MKVKSLIALLKKQKPTALVFILNGNAIRTVKKQGSTVRLVPYADYE